MDAAAPGTRRRRRRRGKLDDDVLTEILLHLPPKSLFKSITVSKRWKHLVADPFFLHTHHKRQLSRGAGALVALFPRSHDPYPPRPPPSQPLINILSLRPPSGRDFRIKRQIPIRKFGHFINSSNGLILCGDHRYELYHVLNPVTGTSFQLPFPRIRIELARQYLSIGLMCEDNTSQLKARFKVIRADITQPDACLNIVTYSSDTGGWVGSTLVGPREFLLIPEPPLVANGVFHWYTAEGELAVYDATNPENRAVHLIALPVLDNTISRAVTRSSSADNTLWFGIINHQLVKFYRLVNVLFEEGHGRSMNREEWELIYDIDIVHAHNNDVWSYRMVLEAFIPGSNPVVAVMRIMDKIHLFNLESRSTELVEYDAIYDNQLNSNVSLCPYIEPLSLSSYSIDINQSGYWASLVPWFLHTPLTGLISVTQRGIDWLCRHAESICDQENNWTNRVRLEAFIPTSKLLVFMLQQRERIYLYNVGSFTAELVRSNGAYESPFLSSYSF